MVEVSAKATTTVKQWKASEKGAGTINVLCSSKWQFSSRPTEASNDALIKIKRLLIRI